MSRVTYNVSRVRYHVSGDIYIYFFFFCKLVKLVRGGSVINGAYPVYLISKLKTNLLCLLLFTKSKCKLINSAMPLKLNERNVLPS